MPCRDYQDDEREYKATISILREKLDLATRVACNLHKVLKNE